VSGVKAALIERLEEDDERQQNLSSAEDATDHVRSTNDVVASPVSEYVINLVKEYIQASGGIAGSRDIGRYLNANSSFGGGQHGSIGSSTALSELKGLYGSLARFINTHDDIFDRTATIDTDGNYEFQVRVK
jgi:hypothetical protein